jgi:hypothetical protein
LRAIPILDISSVNDNDEEKAQGIH